MTLPPPTFGPPTSANRYLAVYAALVLLTATNIGIACVDLGRFNVVVVLLIAVTQATLAALYFMDLRDSVRLTWLVVAVGVTWFLILVTAVIADVLTRGWLGTPGS